MSQHIFVNKKFFSTEDAHISCLDSGYQYGDGLFETMLCLGGRIIGLDRHLERLFSSLAFFKFTLDFSKQDLASWISQTLAKNNMEKKDAYIKVMVSRRGLGQGLSFDTKRPPNIVIIVRKLVPYPEHCYREGINIIRSPILRSSLSNVCYRHKLLNYFENIYSKNEANARGASEAIFLSRDNLVLEGATSNLFIVNGRNITTPPLSYNILPGTTREAVIDICRAKSLNLGEKKFDLLQLLRSDEVFLTNSLMGVMPVSSMDGKKISDGSPGPYTRLVMDLYQSYLAGQL